MSLASNEAVLNLIALAKAEDLGSGDITTRLMANPGRLAAFSLVAKRPGVFAGADIALAVLRAYDPELRLEWAGESGDGCRILAVPRTLATLYGSLASLLSAERVFLNFLQRLSGIATLTRRFVDAVEGTGVTILDTRKTTPGLRVLERYAVRCGGGSNHRSGLFDAVLIKDNHLAGVEWPELAGHVFQMLNQMGSLGTTPKFVEVEAQSLREAKELFKVVGVDVVLLDNFSVEEIREAVVVRDGLGLKGKVALEASGGVTLDSVRELALAGVERISVGALTHSACALDMSLEPAAC